MMAGTIFVAPNRTWAVASWAFHWVAEYLADHVEDKEATDYLREVIDSNMGLLSLKEDTGDFSPPVRQQILNLLQHELVPDAERRLPTENFDREGALNLLRQLADLAREASG